MEKVYVKHYILATYGNTTVESYRHAAMQEIVDRYEILTERIINALRANEVEEPEQLITYTFRMLGDYHDDAFHRREMVEVDLNSLREDITSFPWENWGWVQTFQPLVDVAGFTIVEIDSEYQSFGPFNEQPVDHIAPCYRIYESGRPEYVKGGFTSERPRKEKPKATSWYDEFLAPVGKVIKENAPTLLAIGTTTAACVIMVRTAHTMTQDLEAKTLQANELLQHIEDLVEDALDMPQVVKVELGDDIEVIGTGRRTW